MYLVTSPIIAIYKIIVHFIIQGQKGYKYGLVFQKYFFLFLSNQKTAKQNNSAIKIFSVDYDFNVREFNIISADAKVGANIIWKKNNFFSEDFLKLISS